MMENVKQKHDMHYNLTDFDKYIVHLFPPREIPIAVLCPVFSGLVSPWQGF